MSYLHILQHSCIVLVILSGDLSKINDPLALVQGEKEKLKLFNMCYLVSLPFRINNKKNFDFISKV